MTCKALIFTAAISGVLSLGAGTLEFKYSTNKKDAVYKSGEKIVFTAKLLEDGKAPADKKIQYRLYHDHRIVKRGAVPATGGHGTPGTEAAKAMNKYIKSILKNEQSS